ncbi:MAG: hypothetical protein K2F97_02325, partial [Muribaculaceae bacterium]|nr:hypothetical protein [Muribaculaceae bacterium]
IAQRPDTRLPLRFPASGLPRRTSRQRRHERQNPKPFPHKKHILNTLAKLPIIFRKTNRHILFRLFHCFTPKQ